LRRIWGHVLACRNMRRKKGGVDARHAVFCFGDLPVLPRKGEDGYLGVKVFGRLLMSTGWRFTRSSLAPAVRCFISGTCPSPPEEGGRILGSEGIRAIARVSRLAIYKVVVAARHAVFRFGDLPGSPEGGDGYLGVKVFELLPGSTAWRFTRSSLAPAMRCFVSGTCPSPPEGGDGCLGVTIFGRQLGSTDWRFTRSSLLPDVRCFVSGTCPSPPEGGDGIFAPHRGAGPRLSDNAAQKRRR
jgi:hypothetical protein